MRHVMLAVLTAAMVLGWTLPVRAADPQCAKDVMTLALEKCGTDITCMNAFVAQHKAKCAKQAGQPKKQSKSGQSLQDKLDACGMDVACMNKVMQNASGGGQPPKKPPAPQKKLSGAAKPAPAPKKPPPPGGSNANAEINKIQQRIQACGANMDCVNRIMADMQKQMEDGGMTPGKGGGPANKFVSEGDATWRIAEGATILPKSWLQMFQNALVACGEDQGCWQREFQTGQDKVRSVCGPPRPLTHLYRDWICNGAGFNELGIEQALAGQRVARRQSGAPKSTAKPGKPGQPPDPKKAKAPPGGDKKRYTIPLPKVTRGEVMALIAIWKGRMASRIGQAARDKMIAAAAPYPKTGAAKQAPLVFEEKKAGGDSQYAIRPTRRDWAHAFNGAILTMTAFIARGNESKTLLDAAFWSFLRAAELNLESEHLSNIGFHLNLRAQLVDARKVLAYAIKKATDNADAYNNLAFTLAASGKHKEAEAAQTAAFNNDPTNPHIQKALSRFSAASKTGKGAKPKFPPGYDFGEAFFRLGKRHTIREATVDRVWRKEHRKAQGAVTGWLPPVLGPYATWQERQKDIAADLDRCESSAPEALTGCPFGSYIIHPACKNAPTPAQVAHSRKVREGALCRCAATAANHTADGMNAYIDGSLRIWRKHERKWHYKLRDYADEWAADIQAVNARYGAGGFQFPLEGNYTNWFKELDEDSRKFWRETYPEMLDEWNQLRANAGQREACVIPGPPPKPPVKRPKHPYKPRSQKTFSWKTPVSSFEYRSDGTAKICGELVVRACYEELPGHKGWRAEVGGGPVDVAFEKHNKGPQKQRHPRDGLGPPGSGSAGGDDYRISATVSVSASKFVPGAVKPIAGAIDEVASIGGKFNASWGNKTGFKSGVSTEAAPKFHIGTTKTPIPAYTRLQN